MALTLRLTIDLPILTGLTEEQTSEADIVSAAGATLDLLRQKFAAKKFRRDFNVQHIGFIPADGHLRRFSIADERRLKTQG